MSTPEPTAPDQNSTRTTIDTPPPASFRMLLVSLLSAAIGLVAGVVAFALYKLNRTLHQRFLFPPLVG